MTKAKNVDHYKPLLIELQVETVINLYIYLIQFFALVVDPNLWFSIVNVTTVIMYLNKAVNYKIVQI